MTGLLIYPVIVTIGSAIIIWIIGEIHKNKAIFQKYILSELKHEWKLVQLEIYTMDLFADRLEELGEFIISDEDSQGLLVQVLKATMR